MTVLWVIAVIMILQLAETVMLHRALRRNWDIVEARARRYEKQADQDAARERQMEGWQSMLNAVRALAGQAKEQLVAVQDFQAAAEIRNRVREASGAIESLFDHIEASLPTPPAAPEHVGEPHLCSDGKPRPYSAALCSHCKPAAGGQP